jgi:hypothetical protein
MLSRFIVFFGAITLFGCGSSESEEEDDIISCIQPPRADGVVECWIWHDRADEGCEGNQGVKETGRCFANGYPFHCEGTSPPVWVKDRDDCPPA